MSASEKAMDCKRLTGSMQIVMARLRDPYVRMEPSVGAAGGAEEGRPRGRGRGPDARAAGAQKTVAPVYGGSALTADRQAVYARESAKLEAYNAELAAKGCATLD